MELPLIVFYDQDDDSGDELLRHYSFAHPHVGQALTVNNERAGTELFYIVRRVDYLYHMNKFAHDYRLFINVFVQKQ